MDFPTAVRKMTSMPADQLGLGDRGRLAPSLKADLVILDAEKIIDRATFKEPHLFPDGIHHVYVAGVPVMRDGKLTAARPGGMLRKA